MSGKKKLSQGLGGGLVVPPSYRFYFNIRPKNPNPKSLVFPSPKGGDISIFNFSNRGWKAILTNLGLAIKDGVKMIAYNCWDTLITHQGVVAGHSSTKIARWVGNSSEVIEKKYLNRLHLESPAQRRLVVLNK